MRISTSMQYNSHLNYLQTANTKVDQASTQYNTGLKFQTAGQDPGGMAAKIKYQADITAYERYGEDLGCDVEHPDPSYSGYQRHLR